MNSRLSTASFSACCEGMRKMPWRGTDVGVRGSVSRLGCGVGYCSEESIGGTRVEFERRLRGPDVMSGAGASAGADEEGL